MVSIQPQCPLRKETTLVLYSLHIFLRYLKTRIATWIIYGQIIMIWFLNTTHSFPDLKASPLTPERFENKHPRRHACCQRALILLNVAGYRCTLTAKGLCNSNSAPDGTVTSPVGSDGPRAWKRLPGTSGSPRWRPAPLPGGHASPLGWSRWRKKIRSARAVLSQKE